MTNVKSQSLGTYKDPILGCNYSLNLVESAKDLSDQLKAVLKKNNIDYRQYNRHSFSESRYDKDQSVEAPPQEIYEYQNFFVLQRTNGDLILLDGFRRLLWYTPPATPITVRFYNESELTSQQILTLLVNLNHFKFFANNQSYHERGFSLLLKTVFDVDVMKFTISFDAYLSRKETKSSYSDFNVASGQDKNGLIKSRITNEFFISDVRFLQRLTGTGYLCDKYFGALLYEYRTKSDKEFDVEKFITLVEENKVLVELMDKYKKVGTEHTSKSIELVNKIIEMYRNVFTLMEGGVVEKSFAEKQKECKNLVEQLKKDKSLTKMTGVADIRDIEDEIEELLAKGKKVEFVCVVHPKPDRDNTWVDQKNITIPYGLLEGVKFLKHAPKHLGFGQTEMNIGLEIDGTNHRIWHNYGDRSYGKKYTYLDISGMRGGRYDVDLFVKLDQKKKVKSTEPKKIKKFSYNSHGPHGKVCVLAWTKKEALEIFDKVGIQISAKEFNDFGYDNWSPAYEELLKDFDQSQSCAYSVPSKNGSPNGMPVKLIID